MLTSGFFSSLDCTFEMGAFLGLVNSGSSSFLSRFLFLSILGLGSQKGSRIDSVEIFTTYQYDGSNWVEIEPKTDKYSLDSKEEEAPRLGEKPQGSRNEYVNQAENYVCLFSDKNVDKDKAYKEQLGNTNVPTTKNVLHHDKAIDMENIVIVE